MKLYAKIIHAVICILSLCASGALAWRSFKIIYTSFPYEYNQEVADVKIDLQNNTAGDTTLNIVFNVNEEVDDVIMGVLIALENDEGNYTTLVNRSLNFCHFLKQRATEPILRLIYEDMLKQGNYIKSCPIKKGTYSLNEYHIDEEILPSYIPETSFLVQIQLKTNSKKLLFNGTLHGRIDKSKGFNNLKMFSLG